MRFLLFQLLKGVHLAKDSRYKQGELNIVPQVIPSVNRYSPNAQTVDSIMINSSNTSFYCYNSQISTNKFIKDYYLHQYEYFIKAYGDIFHIFSNKYSQTNVRGCYNVKSLINQLFICIIEAIKTMDEKHYILAFYVKRFIIQERDIEDLAMKIHEKLLLKENKKTIFEIITKYYLDLYFATFFTFSIFEYSKCIGGFEFRKDDTDKKHLVLKTEKSNSKYWYQIGKDLGFKLKDKVLIQRRDNIFNEFTFILVYVLLFTNDNFTKSYYDYGKITVGLNYLPSLKTFIRKHHLKIVGYTENVKHVFILMNIDYCILNLGWKDITTSFIAMKSLKCIIQDDLANFLSRYLEFMSPENMKEGQFVILFDSCNESFFALAQFLKISDPIFKNKLELFKNELVNIISESILRYYDNETKVITIFSERFGSQ